jgi:diguanylate cyclase (GGDEF)-like protein/PAS domain S-box-containing protein
MPETGLFDAHPHLDDIPDVDAKKLLGGILESCSDCIKILDLEGRLVFMSPAGQRSLQIDDISMVIGADWLTPWVGQYRDLAASALDEARAGRAARFEGIHPTAKGLRKWWDVVASPIHGLDGTPERLLVISRDITDQKASDRALRHSAETFRLASRATSDAVWDWDLAADTISWGASAEVLFGYPSGSIDPSSDWWKARVHPEDRARVLASFDEAIASGSEAWQAEYRFLRADGSYAEVLDRGFTLRNGQGQALRAVGAMVDLTEKKRVEAQARALTDRLSSVLESTMDSVAVVDRDWRIAYMNSRAQEQISGGHDRRGESIWSVFPDLENSDLGEACRSTMETGVATRTEQFISPNNSWIEANAYRSAEGLTVFFRDITAKRRAERALRESEQRLRLALRAGRVVAWEVDVETGWVTRSDNARDVLGIASGPTDDFRSRIHPDDLIKARTIQADTDDDHDMQEFRFQRPDGSTIWLASRAQEIREAGRPLRIVGAAVDVTERKASEERLWLSANHDALTGLPNRSLLQARLEQALEDSRRHGGNVSLLLVDLDNFKDINDTIGHDAGDALLRHAAECLRTVTPDHQMVARFGGDEFVILLRDPFTLENAVDLADFVLKALSHPLQFRDRTIAARASIGIAASPVHDRDPVELMKDADLALYAAKARGRNRTMVYCPAMRTGMERRVTVARDIRSALDARQIVPFYQPKVSLLTGKIIGFEALARWQHPRDGLLTPAAFASVFEDAELAVAIGERMIEQVAIDIRRWEDAGLDCGRIAVNLSSAEFGQPELAENVLGILSDAGVSPDRLAVEVTETVFLGHNSDLVTRSLKRLHDAGIRISLDDFGTGYASLTHLKQFPVDEIKVDQSFVRGLEIRPEDVAIVSAVVGLGANLGLAVVAEGIETRGQANYLREMGCEFAQGYLFSRPVASTRVHWLLKEWSNPLEGKLKLCG